MTKLKIEEEIYFDEWTEFINFCLKYRDRRVEIDNWGNGYMYILYKRKDYQRIAVIYFEDDSVFIETLPNSILRFGDKTARDYAFPIYNNKRRRFQNSKKIKEEELKEK
jgi:hypothetical protein